MFKQRGQPSLVRISFGELQEELHEGVLVCRQRRVELSPILQQRLPHALQPKPKLGKTIRFDGDKG